jgi:hypothetical protein
MSSNLPFAGALASLALLASACGTSTGTPAAAARPSADPVAVYHQLGQCVRDHGVPDFPDPTVDAQGRPQLPPGTQIPPDAVKQACLPILNQLPASMRPSIDRADPATMRRLAQCMRAHGIADWPDPGSDGNFRLPRSLAGDIKSKSGPRYPLFQAAYGQCRQYDPSGQFGEFA